MIKQLVSDSVEVQAVLHRELYKGDGQGEEELKEI